jgi:hypothetical protein
MFYEEMKDAMGFVWFRTEPCGPWKILIPFDVSNDVNQRWEKGTPHHPKSLALVKAIQHLDQRYCDGMFDLQTGGDGDNGESLLYLLDILFESNN